MLCDNLPCSIIRHDISLSSARLSPEHIGPRINATELRLAHERNVRKKKLVSEALCHLTVSPSGTLGGLGVVAFSVRVLDLI